MTFVMQPARFPAGGWLEGSEFSPGSDQTYPRGVPVIFAVGSQELDAKATDPTTDILGISLEGVTAGIAANPSTKVNVALAARINIFTAKLTNSAGVVQTADEANVGVTYALLKNGSGATQWWSVNESDSSGGVAEVIDIDTERNLVFFKFTEASIQFI